MYDFDDIWDQECKSKAATYSRSADDIFISCRRQNILQGIYDGIKHDLETRIHPRLSINAGKTVYTSRKRKRMITGIVLTSTNEISIGRESKRRVRNMVFRYKNNNLELTDTEYLKGNLAFANSVEPKFVERLRAKYGAEVMAKLFKLGAIRPTQ